MRKGIVAGVLLVAALVVCAASPQSTNQSGGGGGITGGVNAQTANYTAVAGDFTAGKLITMNGASLTLTLPNPAPATGFISVVNLNNSSLTISNNSLNINGRAGTLVLPATGGALASTSTITNAVIYTDGTNYFALQNLPSGGISQIRFTDNGGTGVFTVGNSTAGVSITAQNGPLQGASYLTATNCSSSASPAVCGSAASGSVVVAAAATTVVVNTTAVTANSQVQLTFDSSLGTKLAVTCNTTVVQPTVSARTGGTSFTITLPTAPTTNPACFSYTIIN